MTELTADRAAARSLAPPTDEDLRLLLLIRRFETRLLELFAQGLVNGTTHTCLGQEYIPVALRTLLHPRDFVFSNHRGHGHYLARFEDPAGLLAEIMGRAGAVCGGVGGSQHILRDRYLSTGVQGESMPVATGTALRLRVTEPGRLACVHIGDGTWGEGAVYEALNLAALWRAPLLVIVENNGIAQSTPAANHLAGTIAGRAAAFGLRYHRVDTTDVTLIREQLAGAVQAVREEAAPTVVEFRTRRLGPHSKGDDTRAPEEVDHARRDDWYPAYRDAYPEQVRRCEAEAAAAVDAVIAEVTARPGVAGAAA
jgi:TPP-dependent pyruvate/acetoin dehydrogenase alpha subunit